MTIAEPKFVGVELYFENRSGFCSGILPYAGVCMKSSEREM